MNSINPFDNLYPVSQIDEYFGIDTITAERARLEVIYWHTITKCLHILGYDVKTLTQRQYDDAINLASNMKYDDLTTELHRTHHEIKALEYTLRSRFSNFPSTEYIHFAITSQDIVDPVYSHAIKRFVKRELIPVLENVIQKLRDMEVTKDSVFPARTHGQLAIPTNMRHEMDVYIYRLDTALTFLTVHNEQVKVKFGGAVGTLSAHKSIASNFEWEAEFNRMFQVFYGMKVHTHTTQVNGNDDKARVFTDLISINNILIDLCQDMWMYFSHGYFTINRDSGHVGSSTMAQKNNPIEFENVEGILQFVNSELHFMVDKLTRSRGQRDLTDSVVQRFYGLMFAKMLHAYTKITGAIKKLEFVAAAGRDDIDNNYQIYAELLQTHLKLHGSDQFEKIKHLFIGKKLNRDEFIQILMAEVKPGILADIVPILSKEIT